MSDYSNKPVLRWGIIGGGLMGREFASALGRWFALTDEILPRAELIAVCDLRISRCAFLALVSVER